MKLAASTRLPYEGTVRSLVIALDIGTTFSGVSYSILEPKEVPKIHGVTRFPGQEHVAGNSKIPSVLYYDKYGQLKAAGAEAEGASIMSQAEDEGWIKAELFKLLLRPKSMKLALNGMRLNRLPRPKTAVDVFGDFLGYLFRCTRNFIIDTHANGSTLWNAVESDIQFVLSHPNGWEGAQQSKMRRSAVYGGLIPNTDEGMARIKFVTEGEASLHACVLNGLAADVLSSPSQHGFVVADAGGGTLDISSYAIRRTSPLCIEEIAPPDCVFAGSVFVSHRAREFLEGKLKNSKYGTPDALDHITQRFDETTKRLFRVKKDMQYIPFGSPLDKDMTVGIRAGQLMLTGDEVAGFFEPSIQAAITSIRAQIEASKGIIKSVWLVGGFAASPWLFSELQVRLAPFNVTVSRPDSQTSKAVADGAIGFYFDHHVSARMSKYMYGVEYLREYDPNDSDHVTRKNRLCELPSGPTLLQDAFDCILSPNVKVKESTVFSLDVWCYKGGEEIPKWILRQADDFSTLCVVRADLSPLSSSAVAKKGPNQKTYYTVIFTIEIHFGLTEFKARLKWIHDGHTKYGPASIVYSESGLQLEEDEPDSVLGADLAEPASRACSRDSFISLSRSGNTPYTVELPQADRLDVPAADASNSLSRNSIISTTRSPSLRPSVTNAEQDDISRGASRDQSRQGRGKSRPPSSLGPAKDGDVPRGGSPLGLAEALKSVWGSATTPAAPFTSLPADADSSTNSESNGGGGHETPKPSTLEPGELSPLGSTEGLGERISASDGDSIPPQKTSPASNTMLVTEKKPESLLDVQENDVENRLTSSQVPSQNISESTDTIAVGRDEEILLADTEKEPIDKPVSFISDGITQQLSQVLSGTSLPASFVMPSGQEVSIADPPVNGSTRIQSTIGKEVPFTATILPPNSSPEFTTDGVEANPSTNFLRPSETTDNVVATTDESSSLSTTLLCADPSEVIDPSTKEVAASATALHASDDPSWRASSIQPTVESVLAESASSSSAGGSILESPVQTDGVPSQESLSENASLVDLDSAHRNSSADGIFALSYLTESTFGQSLSSPESTAPPLDGSPNSSTSPTTAFSSDSSPIPSTIPLSETSILKASSSLPDSSLTPEQVASSQRPDEHEPQVPSELAGSSEMSLHPKLDVHTSPKPSVSPRRLPSPKLEAKESPKSSTPNLPGSSELSSAESSGIPAENTVADIFFMVQDKDEFASDPLTSEGDDGTDEREEEKTQVSQGIEDNKAGSADDSESSTLHQTETTDASERTRAESVEGVKDTSQWNSSPSNDENGPPQVQFSSGTIGEDTTDLFWEPGWDLITAGYD